MPDGIRKRSGQKTLETRQPTPGVRLTACWGLLGPAWLGFLLSTEGGMTRFARLRYVLIAILALVMAIYFLAVVSPSTGSRRQLIGLEVVRLTHDAQGYALAVVQLTNRTHVGFNYAFWNEVLSNGVWVDALTQPPDARMANWLAPHQHRTVELPVPREGSAWRIELDGGWVLVGRVEILLCRACQRLKLPYQFAQDLRMYSQTNEVVAARNPQGGANGSQPVVH